MVSLLGEGRLDRKDFFVLEIMASSNTNLRETSKVKKLSEEEEGLEASMRNMNLKEGGSTMCSWVRRSVNWLKL